MQTVCVGMCLEADFQSGTVVTTTLRDVSYCMHRPTTNEPWSDAKNQISVTYFTGHNRTPKVGVNRYFQDS